ncbi:MAG: tyrosine-type recombinase/integrase [Leptospiraceae bacterium]|nr:tyrosine-type recombinase/integrase [Leptospiraceae bacterium]MCB1315608.1 tyrosine-type recombinase/integrase [Leptospiraceae bacterium]
MGAQLSDRTRQSYSREIRKFEADFSQMFGMSAEDAPEDRLVEYLKALFESKNVSTALRVKVAAIKRWYRDLHGKDLNFNQPLPPARTEPIRILSSQELETLFHHTRHHVCGLVIRLIYASGLRLQEVIQVRVNDVDLENLRITARNEKGEPSHSTIFSGVLRYDIMRQAHGKEPGDFLFSLRRNGERGPMARRTIQSFLARAVDELGLEGKITAQTLRDNFAIHLLRQGIDLRHIMRTMGFKNMRSLDRYVDYIKNDLALKSPL